MGALFRLLQKKLESKLTKVLRFIDHKITKSELFHGDSCVHCKNCKVDTIEFNHPIGGDMLKSSITMRKRALLVNCDLKYDGIIESMFQNDLSFNCKKINHMYGIPTKQMVLGGLEWLFRDLNEGDVLVFYYKGDSFKNRNGDTYLSFRDGGTVRWSILIRTMLDMLENNKKVSIVNIMDVPSDIECKQLRYEYTYDAGEIRKLIKQPYNQSSNVAGFVCLYLKGTLSKNSPLSLTELLVRAWQHKKMRMNLMDMLVSVGNILISNGNNTLSIAVGASTQIELETIYLAIGRN